MQSPARFIWDQFHVSPSCDDILTGENCEMTLFDDFTYITYRVIWSSLRKGEKVHVLCRGGQRGSAVPHPPLLAPPPIRLIKRAQIGIKWTENASETVNFSRFSYPGRGSFLPCPFAISALSSPPPIWNPLPAPSPLSFQLKHSACLFTQLIVYDQRIYIFLSVILNVKFRRLWLEFWYNWIYHLKKYNFLKSFLALSYKSNS